jgi:outer membrane protein assembly factor BamB
VFLGSQDGHVYAVNADKGALLWASKPLGDMVQAAAAGMFKVFGGPFDYILIGTRNAIASNIFYALNVPDGSVAGLFDNGGTGIGIINGGAAVDYAKDRVYFASRAWVPGANTLWGLDITAAGVSFAWGQNFAGDPNPDIDGSPVLRNGRIYVGTNSGWVYSLNAADGSIQWKFNTNDGPIKNFIFPDRFSNSLYLSTTNNIWGLTDGSPTPNWPPVNKIPSPSNPIFTTGGTLLFVGASDGQLYELDMTLANPTTQPVIKSVLLGPGAANVGSPTLDPANTMVYVGTDAGIIYAVQEPLP